MGSLLIMGVLSGDGGVSVAIPFPGSSCGLAEDTGADFARSGGIHRDKMGRMAPNSAKRDTLCDAGNTLPGGAWGTNGVITVPPGLCVGPSVGDRVG